MLAIIGERSRQDAKWGEQSHDPFAWLVILVEEVGEAAKDALEARFHFDSPPGAGSAAEFREHCLQRYRTELIQVAAVAMAAAESVDRGKWRWPSAQ